MRRYLPIFWAAFFVLVATLVSSTYLAGYADKQHPENVRSITIYTTLPVEQIAVIAQQYEKEQVVKVRFVSLSKQDIYTRLQLEKSSPQADIVLASQDVLNGLKKQQLLASYNSEQTDIVADRFKDEQGFWTGLWYDPIVFAVNKDALKSMSKVPAAWDDLIKDAKFRLGVTDFLAADASANLFFTLISVNGEAKTMDFLKKIHQQVVQYAKFLATPVRMAGMGEVDIAIAVQSDAVRYVNDNFPIQIIYPEDGTAYLLTGIGLVNNGSRAADAKQFIDWTLQDSAQSILQQNKFFVIPTNQETFVYKYFADKNIKLLETKQSFTPEQRHELLDKWVQNVRFSSK